LENKRNVKKRKNVTKIKKRKNVFYIYDWLKAGSLGWSFPMLFQIKYTEAIVSNNTRKLLWFEITEMLIAV